MSHTPKTQRAIKAYGFYKCVDAFRKHDRDGEGASTVGFYLGLKTNQADAAINAGREIVESASVRVSYTSEAGRTETTVDGLSILDGYPRVGDCYAPSRDELRNKVIVAHLNKVAADADGFPVWTSFRVL